MNEELYEQILDGDFDYSTLDKLIALEREEERKNIGKELLYVANQTAERTKKELIIKACEWLFKNTRFTENDINDFRKSMEE